MSIAEVFASVPPSRSESVFAVMRVRPDLAVEEVPVLVEGVEKVYERAVAEE